MKFAVIETGGKQYKVREGIILEVEKLSRATPSQQKDEPSTKLGAGSKVIFDKVLLMADEKTTQIGSPYLDGAKVEAILESEKKGKKVRGLRFKNKTHQSTTPYGHRQIKARVKISRLTN